MILEACEARDRDFEELKSGIKRLLHFNAFEYKNSYLKRRFDVRLNVCHLDNYREYWKLLNEDKAEQEQLLKDLTINVTEFFRDAQMYNVFKQQIVPEVIDNKDKLRIWSAGSSDGKEVYSIAMIMLEILGLQEASKRVEILGTDIDQECLQRAEEGVYESKPVLEQTDIAKQLTFINQSKDYFWINGDTYTAKPCLKQLVHFEYHDLISGPKKHQFDIIFCRNVVIYFTRELQEILYKDFYNALNSGGYLVMGRTETLVGDTKNLFLPHESKEHIFIKK